MSHRTVVLSFPRTTVDQPLISTMVRRFNVEVSIIQAHITPDEAGRMVTHFSCEEEEMEQALDFLRQSGVEVNLPLKNLVRHEQLCVHCGACVGQCRSRAFSVDPVTAEVVFDHTRCIACELCIPACGFGVLESIHDRLAEEG
jgi:Fe-S-cluster-containing dehydrogenase component